MKKTGSNDFHALVKLTERREYVSRVGDEATTYPLRRFGVRVVRRLTALLDSWANSGDPYWPLGLGLLYLNLPSQRITNEELSHARAALRTLLTPSGEWKAQPPTVAQGVLAYHLLRLAELSGEQHFERGARSYWIALLKTRRHADGCFPYSARRDEMLVDTLGLLLPFAARLWAKTSEPGAIELIENQFARFDEHAMHQGCGLPFHGYLATSHAPLGIVGWGRGVAWHLIGLVDTALALPNECSNRSRLLQRALAILDRVRKLQREDGHWGWQLLVPDAESDSSATAMIAYSTARLLVSGDIEPEYLLMVERANSALEARVDPGTGWLKGSSGECSGVGQYSATFSSNIWAQGPAYACRRLLER